MRLHTRTLLKITLGMCGAMGIVLGCCIFTANAEDMQTSQTPKAMQSRPNILLVIIDTLRPDHLGCYGYGRKTSQHIDALAANGVLFERVYSTSSWTLPACVSLLSGVYPHTHGATTWGSVINKQIPWLPEILHDKGYYTIGVSSNPFLTSSRGFDRGFDEFDDQTVIASAEWSFPLLQSRHKAMVLASTGATATRRAMELITNRPKDRPFFLMLHYMDCHADYVPPPPWDTAFDPDYHGTVSGHIQSQQIGTDLPKRDMEHVIALYDGEIASIDAHLGQLFEQLDAMGLQQNTCIIVTADHGEEFLEHGQWFHGHAVFEECIKVPLLISWPGITKSGHRVHEPVSLVDVMPTLLNEILLTNDFKALVSTEFLKALPGVYEDFPARLSDNAQRSRSFSMEGMALDGALRGGEAPTGRWLLSETQLSRPLLGIVDGQTKTILELVRPNDWTGMKSAKQFEMSNDPHEQHALVVSPDRQSQIIDRLKTMVIPLSTDSPNTSVDREQLERLKSLGYIGG